MTVAQTSLNLQGKVALVTGSAKRLGRCIALHLAQQGADVVVHFHNSAPDAGAVVAEIIKIGRRAISVQADLANTSEIQSLFARAIQEFGRLDILVNNASNFLHTEFETTSEETWDASLDVNLKAAFFCSQAAAPHLKKNRGSIINLADLGGILAWTGYIPHCVSKAGLIMLTRAMAKKLAPEIRVNAVAPGTITMPGDPPELEQQYLRLAPLLRSGSSDDVTGAISFLLHAPFMTGQVLQLDGGRTL